MPDPSELELLKRALAVYAGEHVLSRVLELGDEALKLGGEVLTCTVLFTDVAKLVPSAETFDWPVANEVIAEYIKVVAEATSNAGGLLDAPIGDAAISYWTGEAHADRACECALAIAAQLASEVSTPKVVPGIGIHSGRILVGNAGAKGRLRFTLTGAAVNTASGVSRMASAEQGRRRRRPAAPLVFGAKAHDRKRHRLLPDYVMSIEVSHSHARAQHRPMRRGKRLCAA